MSLKTCYEKLEGDYEGVVERLRSERLVQKFVLKFLADGSYDALTRAIAEKNGEEAFRAAHTIKGVCQNLNFTKLYESSHELAEALRPGVWSDSAPALYERVTADYAQTVAAIRELEAEVSASA